MIVSLLLYMLKPWIVLKFGGSSVAEPAHWQTISQAVADKHQLGFRPILVFSALKNVSNLLEALLHQSLAGVHPNALSQLKELHLNFASKLHLDINEQLQPIFQQLNEDCTAITKRQQISPQQHAKILAAGELLSTTIGCHYLNQCDKLNDLGLSCHWLDIRTVLTADQHSDPWHQYTSATCDYHYSPSFDESLRKLDQVIITQGFIAANQLGETVLLGREGSDTSAAYIGAKLKAQSIEIWTDVPGVFSANPREVSQAKQIKNLTYQQAHHLAALGAKVLHPRALRPAQEYQIPVQVKSTSLPQEIGTHIAEARHFALTNQTNTTTNNQTNKDTNHLFAVTSETQVTFIKITPNGKSSDTQDYLTKAEKRVNTYLESLGFDLVTQQQTAENARFVFKYSNSDQAPPAIGELTKELTTHLEQRFQVEISSNNACVSLCFTNVSLVKFKTIQTLLHSNNLSFIDWFQSSRENSLSLIVSSQQRLAFCRLFHANFIENQPLNICFGKAWLDY